MNGLDWEKVDLRFGWEKTFPDIQSVLNAALTHASKFRELTRVDVANRLTEELRVKVSEHSMNKWTRHDGKGHRFPLEYSYAFAQVTGDPRILMWVVVRAGLMCLTPKLEKRFRIFELKDQEEKIKSQRLMLGKELS